MQQYIPYITDELYHYGTLGQKWGIRKYQNQDGSLTSAGKKRYANSYTRYIDKINKIDKKKDKINSYISKENNKISKLESNRSKFVKKETSPRKSVIDKRKIQEGVNYYNNNIGFHEKNVRNSNNEKFNLDVRKRKIEKKMERKFKDISIKDMDQKALNYGRKYTYVFINQIN